MRIVLDTNIVLSTLPWQGTPHHLLAVIRQQSGVQLYSSTALLEELADVLIRASATKRLALIGRSTREVLADYVEVTEWVEPVDVPRVVAGDADDGKELARGLLEGLILKHQAKQSVARAAARSAPAPAKVAVSKKATKRAAQAGSNR